MELKWVIVTEDDSSLPPEKIDVLFFNNPHNQYFVGYFQFVSRNGLKVRMFCDMVRMFCDIECTYVAVTHWALIPPVER